jgi:hypothetical protein
MISFRVSEREFEMLRSKSEAEGARSVSEFARLALCGQTPAATNQSAQSGATDSPELTRLRDELQELNAYVRRVAESVERGRRPLPARSTLVAVGGKTGGA